MLPTLSKPAERRADLPNLLALARHDNLMVKISGATLSNQAAMTCCCSGCWCAKPT